MDRKHEKMRKKCDQHARSAALQARLKGLDRTMVGHGILREAVRLIFNVPEQEAVKIASQALPHITELAMTERLRREPGLMAECGEKVAANMATFCEVPDQNVTPQG